MFSEQQIEAIRALIAVGLNNTQIVALVAMQNIGTAVAPVMVPKRDGDTESTERANGVTYRAVVSVDRLDRMKLTPQQLRVAKHVIKHPGQTSRQIAEATGIGVKAVQSPIYQLRSTRPAVLKSSND